MQQLTEKHILPVGPTLITEDGTSNGKVRISDPTLFRVGQIVQIQSNTQPKQELKIKRIETSGYIYLGSKDKPITDKANLTSYTVADSAFIYANEQLRPTIPVQEIERLTYEEEPVIARRVVIVDENGERITKANPLDVRLSDGNVSIGTINAELEVQLSAKDNWPNAGDIADSIRIGDGVDELVVNSDGSINVNVITPGTTWDTKSLYGEVASVAAANRTSVIQYTIPSGKKFYLSKVEFSGENIATWEIEIDGVLQAKRRTYFGGALDGECDFNGLTSGGLKVVTSIEVFVKHSRPAQADFNARIIGAEG